MASDGSLDVRALEYLHGWPLYDNWIVHHGFTSYFRDYDVIVEAGAAVPGYKGVVTVGVTGQWYREGQYRFRFTHCAVANIATRLSAGDWDDIFCDYEAWERAGCPRGFVWGVQRLEFAGARHVPDSTISSQWTQTLGRPMHEVEIKSNAQTLQLIFHRLLVHKVAQGDPGTNVLSPIEPEELE